MRTTSTPEPTNTCPTGYFRLIPGIFVLGLAAVLGTIYLGISSRGARKETRQLRAEIVRLGSGTGHQVEIVRHSELPQGSVEAPSNSASGALDSRKVQSEDLRQRAAASGTATDSLKHELENTQNRLQVLEKEARIAETVVHDYGSGICLLHVVVEFLDNESGRPLRLTLDAAGKPRINEKGRVQLDDSGAGPHIQIDAFGSGFLARSDGKIVTNHHVVEPWWKDDDLKELLGQGATAHVLSYQVYFPGKAEGVRAKLSRISLVADVATLQLESPVPRDSAVLEIDDRTKATVTGEPIVLMGYPTGIEGILARQRSEVTEKILGGSWDVNRVMAQLASQLLIRPTTTQGHISDVLEDKIVYDAATTAGGSGGPLFNHDGKVIGINFATMKGFGGSNLAVPSRYAKELLN
jgi:serine protease Do